LDEHLGDLEQLAKYASQRGPVIFFGHSYGGLVALAGAAAQPQQVQLVVTYEPALPWTYRKTRPQREFTGNPAQEAENFFRRMISDAVWERLSATEKESRRLDGPALLNDLENLRDLSSLHFERIEAPTVYIYGDGPNTTNYEDVALRLGEEIRNFSVIKIDHAPHGAHLANPDRLAAIVENEWEKQCA
jgi:pimeloyl-ACP methyl ester carboxylesterase